MSIEKISNAVWTAFGLSVGVLALLGILAGVIFSGMAFYEYKIHKVPGVAVRADGNTKGKDGLKLTLQYEVPLNLQGIEYFIIPVKLEKKKSEEERVAPFSESSHKNRSSVDFDSGSSWASEVYSRFWGPYYNAVFVNKKTGESRALLERKGFIQEIYFPGRKYGEKEGETKPTFLLYRIAFSDTNRDGIINEEDVLGGYISKLDGTGLTRITPEESQMGGWGFDEETQTLFVEARQDINHDHKFDADDPKTLLSVNILDPKTAREVIPDEIKKKVAGILNID